MLSQTIHPITKRFIAIANNYPRSTVYEGNKNMHCTPVIYTSGAGTPNPDDYLSPHGLRMDEQPTNPVISMSLPISSLNHAFESTKIANALREIGLVKSYDEKCNPILAQGVKLSITDDNITVTADTSVLYTPS